MGDQKKKNRWIIDRLTSKYRLVVMNDETFEEVSSVRLSRINVYILLSTVIVIMVMFITSLIIFTPLKEYIPGYSDAGLRRQAVDLKMTSDSLEQIVKANDLFLDNMKKTINGGEEIKLQENPDTTEKVHGKYDTISLGRVSPSESQLRSDVENDNRITLFFGNGAKGKSNSVATHVSVRSNTSTLGSYLFFKPIRGYVTEGFNSKKEHFGVDIVAPENEPIKATLDGTVVMSNWTLETGWVIAIQHNDNLVSLYKHNSALLKKEGDYVRAGDVIAVVGNSGEQTFGPHLHFELWLNGIAINPSDYIDFN